MADTPTTTRGAVAQAVPNTSASNQTTRGSVAQALTKTSAGPETTRGGVTQATPNFVFVGRKVRAKQLGTGQPFPLLSSTVAGLPSAVGLFGHLVYVSDESGGAVVAFSDGAAWRRMTDRAVVS